MKKPRLIAVMPLRSPRRGETEKMPITAVITPITGTISGKTRPLSPNAALAQDQRGDQHDRVGLEQVRRHAGAVADVVADVVGDRGRVARVVLGDALLDLADQVRADVGGLGEDAAADTHEHREQRRAEAEALEHVRARSPCRSARRRAAPNRPRPTVNMPATPPVRNAIRIAGCSPPSRAAAATRTLPRTHSDIPMYPVSGREHARRPGRRCSGPAARRWSSAGSSEQHEEDDDHEHAEGPELAAQVRGRALLHRARDLLHLLGALAGREDLPHQHAGDAEREQRDDRDDDNPGQVGAAT